MHRFRDGYGLALEWVVMVLMIALSVEVTLGIVFRFSGSSLVWYDEVASVLLAWLTFYGSALASVKRAHIGCPEVVDQLPPGPKRVLGIITQLLVMVSLPWVSMNFVQSVIPVSAALILVGEVMHLIDLVSARTQAQGPSSLADGLH
jgi:TRAP-type transport system small permease protein